MKVARENRKKTLFFHGFQSTVGDQNNPIDQNLEFNKNLRGSTEKWLVWQLMHQMKKSAKLIEKNLFFYDFQSTVSPIIFIKPVHIIHQNNRLFL